ncbi:hypothetical protein SAY87_008757 [Trapa incisa]|uniref:Protein RALF-like 19 n=1 Tax=Trapa incisa TaxID=236973 RepID=A0AAN7Q199_9MYRT|nr:hypothetical protein SAY87_008757 [Trapa incisa]
MGPRFWLVFLVVALAMVVGSYSSTFGNVETFSRRFRTTVGDSIGEDNELMMDSEIHHRLLAQTRYISYEALKKNSVPCNRRGQSYYNCNKMKKVNPYKRGCSVITHCKRMTGSGTSLSRPPNSFPPTKTRGSCISLLTSLLLELGKAAIAGRPATVAASSSSATVWASEPQKQKQPHHDMAHAAVWASEHYHGILHHHLLYLYLLLYLATSGSYGSPSAAIYTSPFEDFRVFGREREGET